MLSQVLCTLYLKSLVMAKTKLTEICVSQYFGPFWTHRLWWTCRFLLSHWVERPYKKNEADFSPNPKPVFSLMEEMAQLKGPWALTWFNLCNWLKILLPLDKNRLVLIKLELYFWPLFLASFESLPSKLSVVPLLSFNSFLTSLFLYLNVTTSSQCQHTS
jgi:hypothetical protein